MRPSGFWSQVPSEHVDEIRQSAERSVPLVMSVEGQGWRRIYSLHTPPTGDFAHSVLVQVDVEHWDPVVQASPAALRHVPLTHAPEVQSEPFTLKRTLLESSSFISLSFQCLMTDHRLGRRWRRRKSNCCTSRSHSQHLYLRNAEI